jgi:hypothetical protein
MSENSNKQTVIVPFKLDIADKRKIDNAATHLDVTSSELIRDAIAAYMRNHGLDPITGELKRRGGDRRSAKARRAVS